MKFVYFLIASLCSLVSAKAQIALKDIFNRNLNNQTIVLTDWEGYMANPAVRLTLTPPASATFPLTVNISANSRYLYFDMPSGASATGPSKTIYLSSASPVSFYVSVFPDRDTISENYNLSISSSYGTKTYHIRVVDQDIASTTSKFKVTVDYSQDTQYGFFNTSARKKIVQAACNDWAYFIDNGNFDSVDAGDQDVYIWTDNYASGNYAYNTQAYKGYYLFAYGIQVNPNISGGGPSFSNFQTIAGNPTGLRRAGAYNADPRGNFNNLGWNTSVQDSTWFLATNLSNVANDLYSIAHHEIGHALNFNPGYSQFDVYKQQGYIDYPELVAYQKTTVPVTSNDHLSDQGNLLVDRVSKKGLFGSEYANVVPYGRWLITKLDLLVLKAIGYKIRKTSAFIKPVIQTTTLSAATVGSSYTAAVTATGGIPFYKFAITSQSLPPGLSLNSFTGVISGTPTQSGTYTFTVKVTDYDSVAASKILSISVSSGGKSFAESSIVLHENNEHASLFSISPNPASGYINITVEGSAKPAIARITGINGVVYSAFYGQQLPRRIPVSKLPDGIYLVEIIFEDRCREKKLFIKN